MQTIIGTIKRTSKLAEGKKSGKAWKRKNVYVLDDSKQMHRISVLGKAIDHIPANGTDVAIDVDTAMYNERPQYTAVFIESLD